MRARFLRAPTARRSSARRPSHDLHLLGAYLDLTTDDGPLHARSVADLGRRLLVGEPLPSYQINTPSILRASLCEAVGEELGRDDPREVPPGQRSPRWEHLCARLEEGATLTTGERAAIAATLSKLGFWAAVSRLVGPGITPGLSADHARLALLRCNAELKLRGPTPATHAAAREVLAAVAGGAATLPVPTRVAAAVNLIVHHAKSDRSLSAMEHAKEVADRLASAAPDRLTPVQLSCYWRGVSFLPFLTGDHGAVREMLDEAERCAAAAVEQADEDERLLARENEFPLLETRGRAAEAAGDLDEAERYYQALVRLDPEDTRVHVRLGDHLFRRERFEEARRAYQEAAALGVPYTSYAQTQAARCSLRLDDRERALAALCQAVAADPAAITPLLLLGDALSDGPLRPLRPWAERQIQALLEPLRGRSPHDD